MRTIAAAGLSIVMTMVFLGACSGEDDGASQSSEAAKRPGPGGKLCGNRKIDTGEQCDGTLLNGETCSTVTGGQKPSGVLKCTGKCTFDTKGCRSGGGAGSGGTGGMGGGGGLSASR